MSVRTLASAGLNRAYVWTVAFLALTGAAQMPIFKRYYVADIPGLGWLAMYYTTHALHYAGAAVFLFILGWSLAGYGTGVPRPRPTVAGGLRLAMLSGVVLTGILRTVKNLPGVALPWPLVMTVDIAHLGFAMGLGLVFLISRFSGKIYWISEK